MPDYSEFPTTPTAWQEAQLRDWQTITPLETEEWGERYFQVTDPCGVVIQLVQWV